MIDAKLKKIRFCFGVMLFMIDAKLNVLQDNQPQGFGVMLFMIDTKPQIV